MQRMLKSFLINSYFSKHRKNIASTCAQRDALSKCCRLWALKFTENTWFVRNNLKLFWNLKNNSKQELVQSQYLPLKRHKVNAVLALLILTLNIFIQADHSFSTYAKFSGKLTFLTPQYAHVHTPAGLQNNVWSLFKLTIRAYCRK